MATGGTLYQDINTQLKSSVKIEHRRFSVEDRDREVHKVNVIRDTPLHTFSEGLLQIGVNTLHHQAIKKLGEPLRSMAVADDGIIEAVYHPDKKFVMVADLGVDQVKVYRINENDDTLMLVDTLPCDLESAPRHFIFSKDGRYMYLMYEVKNVIDVYTYETGKRAPKLEKIQTISTTGEKRLSQLTAACAIRFSSDEKHLFCSNAGDDTVSIYKRDEETGLLELICCLPISGEYPKDIAIFPDDQHIASLNHETGSITFFHIDYEKGLLVGSANPVRVDEPNCCAIVKVRG